MVGNLGNDINLDLIGAGRLALEGKRGAFVGRNSDAETACCESGWGGGGGGGGWAEVSTTSLKFVWCPPGVGRGEGEGDGMGVNCWKRELRLASCWELSGWLFMNDFCALKKALWCRELRGSFLGGSTWDSICEIGRSRLLVFMVGSGVWRISIGFFRTRTIC